MTGKEERVARLRKIMEDGKVDAFWVASPENIYYLSGFIGGMDGKLLITPKKKILITDPRYEIQAKQESPDYERVIVTREKLMSVWQKELLAKVKRLGYEENTVTKNDYDALNKVLRGLGSRASGMASRLEWFRTVMDGRELALMKKSALIAHESFNAIKSMIGPGVRERDIASALENEFRRREASERSFPSLIASGPNGAKPHHMAGDKRLKKGELVVCDFGAKYKWYNSDQTNTVAIGKISGKLGKIYYHVRDAYFEAISKARCGDTESRIDAYARDYLQKQGFGEYFTHSLGHGLGLGNYDRDTFHLKPILGPGRNHPITENMVMTIEPGIYIEGVGGVRIEAVCVMTRRGLKTVIDYGDRQLETF